MAAKNHGISLDLLIHPGETISDLLDDRGITQKELAQRAGVSEAFLSDVIHGKKDISKSLAIGLEYALGISTSFWLNLQANYDAELLSIQEEDSVQDEERTVLTVINEIVKHLKTTRVVSPSLTTDQTVICLRKYFRVSSLGDLKKLAPAGAFRMSEKAHIEPTVLGAWLCICKAQGDTQRINTAFDPTKTNELIDKIKQIMCSAKGDPQKPLKELFAQYGIDFSIVHNFRGAPVHGYIARKEDESYQMVLTIRGAFADIFWFSLFHELGHIVNGDLSKPGSFIDADYNKNSDMERAADHFASGALLDPNSYKIFISKEVFSFPAINSFAKQQNVPSFVVIGRLQKDNKIPWNRFTKYKPRYKWAEA